MNVAVVPEYETVPVTPPIVKVEVVMVDDSIVSENAAAMALLIAAPVALLAGLVNDTVGAVVSGAVPVVVVDGVHSLDSIRCFLHNYLLLL